MCMSSHRTKTKVWSSDKTKTKGYLWKQTFKYIIFSMCIFHMHFHVCLAGGKFCHRMPNPMFVLAGRVKALCLMHKDAEFGLLQKLHQSKKYVYCSTLCPPFFRMEINNRGAKVYCSGALQEHCSALKKIVHDACSGSVYHYTSAFQLKFCMRTQY